MRFLTHIAKAMSKVFGINNEQVTIRAKNIVTPIYKPESQENVKAFEAELARLQSTNTHAPVKQVPGKQPWELQLENMPLETRYMLGKFMMAPSKDFTNVKDLLTTYNTNDKLVAYLSTKPGIRNAKRTGRHYNLDSIMNEHEE